MVNVSHLYHRQMANQIDKPAALLPGIALCLVVTRAAYLSEAGERAMAGKAWLEALVLAILIGTAVRNLWTPGYRWHDGIAFSAKYLLEVAVALLGASVSAATIMAAGLLLLAGVAAVVACAILLSDGIGRMLGAADTGGATDCVRQLDLRNSAIAAVAPVIGAGSDDVAAAIAFTAGWASLSYSA